MTNIMRENIKSNNGIKKKVGEISGNYIVFN